MGGTGGTRMLRNTHARAVGSAKKSKGYFIFELALSALMIAAIVVLAFPTYQDFTPEYDVVGEISVLEQAEQSQGLKANENPAGLTADQQENEPVSSQDAASPDENTTS